MAGDLKNTGKGNLFVKVTRVDFYLGSTKLNSEGSAPWNCRPGPGTRTGR